MFKLDHLEISGFKSFVDPVSVKFTGSLNAIVGPNGCGKSNVSDAVTWVLGERSAKTCAASRWRTSSSAARRVASRWAWPRSR